MLRGGAPGCGEVMGEVALFVQCGMRVGGVPSIVMWLALLPSWSWSWSRSSSRS
jgi:hypothetical protein